MHHPSKDRAFPPMCEPDLCRTGRTMSITSLFNMPTPACRAPVARVGIERRQPREREISEARTPAAHRSHPHAVDVPCWRIWNVPVADALRRLHQKPEGE